MIKIRVSYNTQEELEKVLKTLKPIILSCKIKKVENGPNKKVYITIK